MGVAKEFRDFAMRGNVIDMAVGIIIGAAFSTIVKTMVDKVIMPPIGMIVGNVDFSDLKLVLKEASVNAEGAEVAEVAIGYGEFINAVISFLIVAFCLFMVVKAMNNTMRRLADEDDDTVTDPPPVSEDTLLLREIRDALKRE